MKKSKKEKETYKTKSIMIVGVGGQGTLLTSRILGKMLMDAGLDVKMSEVHGMAQRGGSVVTYVRYGSRVFEPIVEEGCADILISFELLEAKRYQHFLKPGGVLVVNDQKIEPMPVLLGKAEYPEGLLEEFKEKYKVLSVKAMEEAKKLGNPRVFNIIVLGLAAKYMSFGETEWYDIIEQCVPPKTVEINKKAFSIGFNL